MPSTHPIRWEPRDSIEVPASATGPTEMAPLAKQLSSREQQQLVKAFDAGLYEIGATFVWSRTMAGLKERLATLGVEFIAEILDRTDIRPTAEVHEVLTDYEAVRLAEDLGMFNSTQALRLRQTLETIAHFANRPADDDEGMMPEEAIRALRACINTVLGQEDLEVAVEFADFRRRLETSLLPDDAPEIDGLVGSAYFFKRTVIRTLLAASKTAKGAQLENVLANLNLLLPPIWPTLKDPDRYIVGRAYAALHADGQSKAASGLRSALMKTSGFDYVPESLRSSTFLEAADKVQKAHFGWDNFYNEPAPMQQLASLGTSIPGPAFHRCMTAIILVKIGNRYGISNAAQDPADQMLSEVTVDRWKYFFDQCLPVDDALLGELMNETIAKRWCDMVNEFGRIARAIPSHAESLKLLEASRDGNARQITALAQSMYASMRRTA